MYNYVNLQKGRQTGITQTKQLFQLNRSNKMNTYISIFNTQLYDYYMAFLMTENKYMSQ